MELIKVYDGYIIGKKGLYIAGYRAGKYKLVTDHTYAKHYSLRTAKKIFGKLKKST